MMHKVGKVVVDYKSCDFCGVTIEDYFEEVTIANFNAECRTIFDCCPVCWKLKVMPAIKALGSGPRTE